MSAPADLHSTLTTILKRYDRIGFGRRGVLDAEADIRSFAATLSPDERARLGAIVTSWIATDEAERITARLQYNLIEHLQALALRLCASLPIPESTPLLLQLQAEGAFQTDDARICREALDQAVTRLIAD